MADPVEYYSTLFDEATAFYGDGTTVLVVRGATVADVVAALGGLEPDEVPTGAWESDEVLWSTYTLAAIEGGVLATEDSGYADPPNSTLVGLSQGGRSAAVVRDNHQAHSRFGCARDGALLFDDHEYTYLDDKDRSRVPDEIRALFDRAWVDLDDDDAVNNGAEDPTAVGLAMAEVVTGIRLTPEDVAKLAADNATVVAVRALQYAEEL